MTTTLIIPGLNSSGPTHWQTWFEEQLPGTVRVIQRDWSKADLPDWSTRIERDISRNPGRHFLVAHSFGALASVHAGVRNSERIAGAFLVAPADPDKFGIAADLPQEPLPFPTVVVGSANDPWIALWKAAEWADRWGADFVSLGEAGHINAAAGFGPWPEGLALFERLRRRSERRAATSVHGLADRTKRPLAWKSDTETAGPKNLRRSVGAVSRLGAG